MMPPLPVVVPTGWREWSEGKQLVSVGPQGCASVPGSVVSPTEKGVVREAAEASSGTLPITKSDTQSIVIILRNMKFVCSIINILRLPKNNHSDLLLFIIIHNKYNFF